ncbi:MAG: DUF4198 domain-containing protein [Clostridia bacterium]|jgi:uncharacterized GH25 family protein|nr:DUF4198 domain-containing protein [Clostridia bacterium]
MKKSFRTIILAIVFSFLVSTWALAHELWFQLDPDGEAGQEHMIELIWGHFPDNIDPESAYFNSIGKGELWVLTPKGERIDLELTKRADRYQAKFTPKIGGDYQVIFYHNRGVLDWAHSEPEGIQSIETAAKAYIDVHDEEETEIWDQLVGLPFEIKAITDVGHLHAREEMESQLLYNGKPLAGVAISVLSPGEAVLELTTDANGIFKFTPDVEGPWLIKAAYFDNSVTQVAGQDVIGARNSLTMLVQPHAHEDDDTAAKASGTTYIYLLAVVLFAGAGFMFVKSKK